MDATDAGSPGKPKGCRRFRRVHSTVTCPWCGLRYENYRGRSVPPMTQVWAEMIQESAAAQAEGDFTKQTRLNTVLGRMRQLKQASWKDEHLLWCRMEHEEAEEPVPF